MKWLHSTCEINGANAPFRIHPTPSSVWAPCGKKLVADFIGQINTFEGPVSNHRMLLPGGALPGVGLADGIGKIYCRPEDIRITAGGGDGLSGVVLQTQFMGDRTRVWVSDAGHEPIIVDAQGRSEFRAGQAVTLDMRPEQMIMLDRRAESV